MTSHCPGPRACLVGRSGSGRISTVQQQPTHRRRLTHHLNHRHDGFFRRHETAFDHSQSRSDALPRLRPLGSIGHNVGSETASA